jgi:REP element-mobilizing transposase RayT
MTSEPASQNRDRQGAAPTTYLITWVCYGSWLPGQTGAIPRTQNQFGARLPASDSLKEQQARDRMTQPPYFLDAIRRRIVLNSVQEVCTCRGWALHAAHVRTNHIHVVITADRKPEHVMNALKAYSSRALNNCALDRPDRRKWARHGSTRYLWAREAISAAIHYVVREQGEAMAVLESAAAR